MKVNLQDVFSKAVHKKSLVIVLVAIVALPILFPLVHAWDPDQHVGMGNMILEDLLNDSTPGKVNINGVDYEASQIVYNAIKQYPLYYKCGCIGPDGYPDIIFGQMAIHPGTGTDEDSDADVYSYEWFDHLLSDAASAGGELSLKAIAFTYGFMSHAAGDMFCHTFVNGLSGGTWKLLTNGLRHVVIEKYVDKLTGWGSSVMTQEECDTFSSDDTFNEWICSSLIDNAWARAHTSGVWEDDFYGLFLGLRDQIRNNWLKEWDKDAVIWVGPIPIPNPDRAWWSNPVVVTPVVSELMKYYFENWVDDINNGLKAWVGVSTQVAYDLFIQGNLDGALDELKDWFLHHFLSMIGLPDWVGDIAAIVGDVTEWISDLLSNIPGLKQIFDFINSIKDTIVDWAFEQAFGVTPDELEDYLKNPANYLDSALFAGAPYHPQTREEIDEELSFALQSGTFDPLKFDPTYNTIMMSKLLLLDGAGLNKLLAGYGVGPLYTQAEAVQPSDLTQIGMCVMQGSADAWGFMKSLDGDYQWMKTAPDGLHSYGTGTPLWEIVQDRERVFKKIFHLGLDMDMTPTLDLIPGQTGIYDIEVMNTENTHDTFALSVDGVPTIWSYQLSANIVELDAGASADVTLNIVPYRQSVPHSTPSTAPGDYPFTVTGVSQGLWKTYDLVPTKIEYGNVHVLPYYEPHVEITPETSTTKPGGTRAYALEVSNFGNVPDSFSLTVQYLDFGLTYRAVPTAIQTSWTTIDKTGMGPLDPAAFDTATLTIAVPSDWAGMENTTYQFNAIAASLVDPHIPPASTTVSAELIVQATKESMARYIDLELRRLTDEVQASGISSGVKVSLLAKLNNAIDRKELALGYILAGKNYIANNMLQSCYGIDYAFSSEVRAQRDKHVIPTALANSWIAEAKQIMTDLQMTIAKPIQD